MCCCCCFCCSLHTLANGWVFRVHLCVFRVFFGALVCVWNVFSPLSNIVNYRKKLYSSTKCDSENASPTLVENPRSLHGLLENYYLVAQNIVASFKDQREYFFGIHNDVCVCCIKFLKKHLCMNKQTNNNNTSSNRFKLLPSGYKKDSLVVVVVVVDPMGDKAPPPPPPMPVSLAKRNVSPIMKIDFILLTKYCPCAVSQQ